MLKHLPTVLAASAVIASGAALAERSFPSEAAGYATCSSKIKKVLPSRSGVIFSRWHYVAEFDDSRRYYINFSAWDNRQRVQMRSECETNRIGNRVLAVSTHEGRYRIDRGTVTIDVASR